MKKIIGLLLGLILLSGVSYAQIDYGNAWYRTNSDRTFIKLVVEEDGIYRVTKAELEAAGYNLSNVAAEKLQIYYRDQEIPIYVQKDGNSFSYVEFFGEKNNGSVDSIAYRDPITGAHKPDLQPNKNISLYTDRSAYFLTWSNIASSIRYFKQFDPTYQLSTPVNSFRYTSWLEYGPMNPEGEQVRGGGGSYDSFYTLNSDFVTGEGYCGPRLEYNKPRTVQIETPLAMNNGSSIDIKARVFGRSKSKHKLQAVFNQEVTPFIDTTIENNVIYIKTYQKDYQPLSNLGPVSTMTFTALQPNIDNNNLCWASVTYEHQPDLGGDSTIFITDWDKGNRAYLELDNVVGDDTVIVYDRSSRVRSLGLIQGSKARVIITGLNTTRDLYLATDRAIKKPKIEQASLNKLYDRSGADYVIVTHRELQASAEAYATYRDTVRTLDLSTTVVYTDEIYDEFGYGSLTPWAIKRFCKYALDNWSTKPRYFLFWGKGYDVVWNDDLVADRRNKDIVSVPSFGYPGTDWEFVAHFDQQSSAIMPEAAIGRVNVFNNESGLRFLEKIDEYEHRPWESWMKEGVFLGGGNTLGEQNSISDAFNFFTDVFSEPPFGGKSHYFQKDDSGIFIDPSTASYHDEIELGVGMVHFFGHSTSNVLDISLRNPSEYNNFGRPVFMVAMGCYGGDFTGAGQSFGEKWLLSPRRGAVGYLANSSAGYLRPLKDYGKVLYSYFYDKKVNEPIGDILQATVTQYADSFVATINRNHARQMNLQGDPALRIFYPEFPDLAVEESGVSFTPENFSAQDDSFRINIQLGNYGLVTKDTFALTVVQKLPNGETIRHDTVLSPVVQFEDTLSIVLQNKVGNAMTGQNTFEVFIDAFESIEEYNESNNLARVIQPVPGNIPAILFPSEFAIVSEPRQTLKASAFFMTRESDIPYVFEIDTVYDFSSSAKVSSETVLGNATFVSWDIPFELDPDIVYYWRVRLKDVSPVVWSTSSFKYIPGQQGWAQAKFPQFLTNPVINVTKNETQQKWEFESRGANYIFKVENGNFIYDRNGTNLGNASLNGYSSDGVVWVIIDQYSLEPISKSYFVGDIGVANAPFDLAKLQQAIATMKEGDYIVVGSSRNPRVPQWDQATFDALKQVGISDNLKLLQDDEGFLLFGRKGLSAGATEILYPNVGTNIYVIDKVLYARTDKGRVSSRRIGPALDWKNIEWDWKSLDVPPQERVRLTVYGTMADGQERILGAGLTAETLSLDTVEASKYPYLRLEAFFQDTIKYTAPQLENWHVYYVPSSDAVVDLATNFEFRSDTIFEGQDLFLHMAARNIGQTDFDSMKVAITVEREDRSRLIIDTLEIPPLLANDVPVEFEFTFPSTDKDLKGKVLLIVSVNPGLEQPETNEFNNFYIQEFLVVNDDINPILDVTFDGKHILDGDIVSPAPEILIQVNDENPFMAVEDSSAFEVYFKEGNTASTEFERIFINGDPRIEWEPATLPENKARLFFNPGVETPLQDSTFYTLRVQGRDQKGNAAGKNESFYEISFQVLGKSTVTQVLNYPNPFSTSTRFVYTLTGAELPELFQIHIYTVTGRLVKIIDLIAEGDVYFGRNITNYAWDGTDEYGDLLANGVYLYRVVTKLPGSESIELIDEQTKDFFNKGWGKMVIIR
ncbi:MAG: C25 family cysteine peptidase [Bacteroidota bacterium]